MSLSERIFIEVQNLPEDVQRQLLDYTLFLKERQKREDAEVIEDIRAVVSENLPALKELAK